ncbi:MAG TPA: hypothetical protein VIJ12_09215 [Candidatus Baltobacteraceae bacterium]
MNRRTLLAALAALPALPAAVLADPTPSPAPLPGRTILRPFDSAPFPHASRAGGHDYQGKHYDAATYYSDSTVGIYVPSYYRPGPAVDLIFHFHGWSNDVPTVFTRYQLREQLEASRRNAILIVPQGPKDAPDSGDGKIELDDGGFARLATDVAAYLQSSGITTTTSIGNVVVTAHSGGYGAVGGLLTRGGMNASITDVILFDALYAYFDAFANWVAPNPARHFLSLYTAYTATDNATVIAMMRKSRPDLVTLDGATMTLAQLQTRAPTFIATTVAHDELMQKLDWYELFLKTTALATV